MDFNYIDSLAGLMKHVMKLYRQNVDILIQDYEVFPGQPPLLLRLAETGGQIQKELALYLNIEPATLTVMVKRMEKSGLVERRHDRKDQRVSWVFLTDKGCKAAEAVRGALQKVELKCFANFSPEEKMLFRRLLLQMRDDLEKFRQEDS